MYEPPIKINYGDPEFQTIRGLRDKTDQTILYAVMDVGIQVDKDELEKTLQYDRRQYEGGYRDALIKIRDRLIEMVNIIAKELDDDA